MLAHVQVRNGLPATSGCYSAWRSLTERGWEVRPYIESKDMAVRPDEPVVGGIGSMVGALGQLGVVPPDIDYPEALRPYCLDPDFERRTMGWVRSTPDRWPLFVKPTTGRKEFVGLVIRSSTDLLLATEADDGLPVFVARPVDLTGRPEWRAFVVDGEVRDVRPYGGCPDEAAPPRAFVQELADLWTGRPRGCSIDLVNVGPPNNPEWRVVECNDGYALADYGLHRSTGGFPSLEKNRLPPTDVRRHPCPALSNRTVGTALLGAAAALTVVGVAVIVLVGWPVAGSDGPSVTELRLAKAVLTAPLWTALLLLAVGGIAVGSSKEQGDL